MNKSLFLPSEWDITSKKEQNYIAPTNIDALISMADSIENFRPIAVKIAMDSPKDIISVKVVMSILIAKRVSSKKL